MTVSSRGDLRALLFAATALAGVCQAGASLAQTAQPPSAEAATAAAAPAEAAGIVVEVARTTRSSVLIGAPELQKILPGVSPLKAIETLPGVIFETADPWGNNEQNEALFVHGFSTQQLGFTMDGVPLGDQQYGNYNGLSVSRAVTSENVGRVVLSSGAGGLGVASTSNLGGAIETFSRDPSRTLGVDARQTFGSYDATRSFLRLDTPIGDKGALFISYLHHDARAWDFNGHQRDNQVNLKYVHDDSHGKLTVFFDWQAKVEPNEDSTGFGNQQTAAAAGYTPYTRPFIYPNIAGCLSYLTNAPTPGTPPVAVGNNFTNCFSAAQRTDILGYVKYDWMIAPGLTWSNQLYKHYGFGRGIVAGPINQAGLPGLFATYFPSLVVGASGSAGTLANISTAFGGTGNEVRTTEYRINREGAISTLDWELGAHHVEAGIWFEHNEPAQHRVWYPFSSANRDLSPYTTPKGPSVFTQYFAEFFVNDTQLHLQDQWRILPNLLLQAGVKSSLQHADGKFPINQQNLPTVAVPVHYPSGSIDSNNWFLPQAGAVWDATAHEQIYVNVQKNMRQLLVYGAGGASPWSLGTQAAFELFKQTAHPETSWTYEGGIRTKRSMGLGFVTGIEGQINVYHVDFSNRLFNIAPFNFINPAPSILVNVGGVATNGADVALTLHFGPHFQVYNALSYNDSTYSDNYSSGTTSTGAAVIVPIAGKRVPLDPTWLDKFIASTTYGPFEAQLSGDFIGRRDVSYLNDQSVKSTFVLGLEASYRLDNTGVSWLQSAKLSGNITNLADVHCVSTAVVTGASGGYQAYPLPPRMFFVTLQTQF